MRLRPRAALFAVGLLACGSRTGLLVPEEREIANPDSSPGPTGDDDSGEAVPDAGRDATEVEDALPPIDVTVPVDAFNNCPDAGSTFVYLVTEERELLSFYPPTAAFTTIGTLDCPAGGAMPFSMAVDQTGIAYVLYTDGEIFRVSTATAACRATAFRSGQSGFAQSFGMGFSQDATGGGETLYVASSGGAGSATPQLATIDTRTFALHVVGSLNPPIASAELTGTGAGDLFAFYGARGNALCDSINTKPSCPDSAIGQLDKTTGRVTGQAVLSGNPQGTAWAFAFWGGSFTRSPRRPAAREPSSIASIRSTTRSSSSRSARIRSWARAFRRAPRRVEREAPGDAARPPLVRRRGSGRSDPSHGAGRAAHRRGRRRLRGRGSRGEARRARPRGKRIACLVAGDPLESPAVVARVRAAAAAGVPFEVVPGVGARGAAAAFAGVLGRAVRVAAADVAEALATELPATVVTIIAGAGSPSQRVVTTTASDGARCARELGDVPVILAFGAPEEALRWAERRPLFGKRVLVTRARDQAGAASALLRERGAEPIVLSTIEIHPPVDAAPLLAALAALRAGDYDWVAFTSANGVDRTWDALAAAGGDSRAFGATRIAAIGPATARAVERRGVRADLGGQGVSR